MPEQEKKKVTVIFASPHKNGAVGQMTRALPENLPQCFETAVYNVFEMNPLACNDCGYCKKHDACIQKDLDAFTADFEAADVVVIATPVYNFSFPAPLKAIFDRFQRYYNARFCRGIKPPIEKRKCAVLISSCGNENLQTFDFMIKQTQTAFTVLNTKLIETVLCPGTDSNRDFSRCTEKASDAARKIIEAVNA